MSYGLEISVRALRWCYWRGAAFPRLWSLECYPYDFLLYLYTTYTGSSLRCFSLQLFPFNLHLFKRVS